MPVIRFGLLSLVWLCLVQGVWATPREAVITHQTMVRMKDGHHLRLVRWVGADPSRLTVVLLQGRSSFVEKNLETIQGFLDRGYNVWTFDWRGQGGSDRLLPNRQKTHIDHYDLYVSDVAQVMAESVLPHIRGPVLLVGLSMGGHIALRYGALYPDQLVGIVAIAPMIDVSTKPFPRWVAEFLTRSANLGGFKTVYAAGYGDYDPKKSTFEKNTNTHDRFRFERNRDKTIQLPQYVTAGPTYGWVRETFRSIALLKDPKALAGITVPVLMVSAGEDKVVDTRYDDHICAQMSRCTHHVIEGSYHNIPNESDPYRQIFWRQFDTFVKGL